MAAAAEMAPPGVWRDASILLVEEKTLALRWTGNAGEAHDAQDDDAARCAIRRVASAETHEAHLGGGAAPLIRVMRLVEARA